MKPTPLDDFPGSASRLAAPRPTYRVYDRDEYQRLTGCRDFRRWRNPTRATARADLTVQYLGRRVDYDGIPPEDRMRTVVIPPGGELDLPRVWDMALICVIDGEVRGGLIPFLVPLGVVPIPLCDGLREGSPEPLDGPEPEAA